MPKAEFMTITLPKLAWQLHGRELTAQQRQESDQQLGRQPEALRKKA
jgi:hypothetical protein